MPSWTGRFVAGGELVAEPGNIVAASVYGASSGMRTALIDAVLQEDRRQLSHESRTIQAFPPLYRAAELAERAKIQAEKFNVHIVVPRRAVNLTERAFTW